MFKSPIFCSNAEQIKKYCTGLVFEGDTKRLKEPLSAVFLIDNDLVLARHYIFSEFNLVSDSCDFISDDNSYDYIIDSLSASEIVKPEDII